MIGDRYIAVSGDCSFGTFSITRSGFVIGKGAVPAMYSDWGAVEKVILESGLMGTRIVKTKTAAELAEIAEQEQKEEVPAAVPLSVAPVSVPDLAEEAEAVAEEKRIREEQEAAEKAANEERMQYNRELKEKLTKRVEQRKPGRPKKAAKNE